MSPCWHADFAEAAPFHHLTDLARPLTSADWPALPQLNAMAEARSLVNTGGLPLRFAPQHVRCGQWNYEAGILANGVVPSREHNWHDLLNALTWLAFPRTKAVLNSVQCAALGQGRGMLRGPLSDAATLFDESGLLLLGRDDDLAELLAARCWQEVFVARRQAWENMRAYVFGHAVLEKLLLPWPGITAKCLFLRVKSLPEEGLPPGWVDSMLADAWRGGRVTRPGDLFPLPVLGIPGWWSANADAEFYQDSKVFRPLPVAVMDTTQSA